MGVYFSATAEAEERELCSSLDVEARKELSTHTSVSNLIEKFIEG
jgi:hypothetical protein